MHVDTFIDTPGGDPYARLWFEIFRLPELTKLQPPIIHFFPRWKLFCDFSGMPGTRFRVTGCSRHGDVWLTADFARDCGYEYRVRVAACSNWGAAP